MPPWLSPWLTDGPFLALCKIDEQTLRRHEYFGQYGKVVKVVVNRTHVGNDRASASASAYVTYANKEDAKAAIQAVNEFWLDGRMIR